MRIIGAAEGNIMATIITAQSAINSAALIPIVKLIPWLFIAGACQMSTPQAIAASISSVPRIR